MKKRILFVAVLIISLFINSISPALAALRADPIPRISYDRDLYQTDLFTGAASYSYPIKVPKGTNDLTPEVALSYNSHGAFEPSAASGMGWELSRDYIERDVNFTPSSTGDDKFFLHFKGTTQELVYVAGDGRYHTKIESNLHISKLTSGEENDYNEYWQVITPDGTKYRFGQGTNSEQVCNGRSSVYRWNLDQVEDRHTNKIFYTYAENSGASYLDKIEYNTEKSRIIDFEYITNPYQRQVYVQGCNITETSQLNNIEVKVANGATDIFDLNDKTANGNNLTNHSGSEYTNSLPFSDSTKAVSLVRSSQQYLSAAHSSSLNTTSNLTIEAWINPSSVPTSDNVTHTIVSKYNDNASSNQSYIFGLFKKPGVGLGLMFYGIKNGSINKQFFKAQSISTSTWTHVAMVYTAASKQVEFFVNGSSIGTDTDTSLDAIQSTTTAVEIGSFRLGTAEHWDGKIDDIRIWNTTRTQSQLNTNKSIELNGDESGLVAYYPFEAVGLLLSLVRQYDLSYTTTGNNGQLLHEITERGSDATASALPATRFNYNQEISSWDTTGVKWIDHAEIGTHLEDANPEATIADVNGDGLVDIVKSTGSGSNSWYVYKNTGSSWNTTPEIWVNNAPIAAQLSHSDTILADVTGDSLPDIIKTNSSGDQWTIFRNTGTSWNTSAETWANDSDLAEPDDSNIAVVDVTGDGLADIVKTVDHGSLYASWKVFKNTGSSWNTTEENWVNNIWYDGTLLSRSDVALLDVNGDGLPDIVRTYNSGSNATWKVYKNTGSSWSTSPETWINNAAIDAYLGKDDVAVSDANGDGLIDIVKNDNLGTDDRWKVLLNQGNSWSTTWEVWIDPSAGMNVDIENYNVRIADVTGDGLPDILRGVKDCACNYVTWTVWENEGYAPQLLSEVHTSQGGKISFDYANSITQNSYTMDSGSYTGEYFNNKTLSGSPVLTRTDTAINFDWGTGSPHASVNANIFSVRWTKTASFSAGAYTFATRSDDGVRLYIDGELLIDKWIDQGATVYSATKMLTEGNHTIVYEYYEDNGSAVADLTYSKSGLPFSLWLVDTMTLHNGMTNTHQTNDITSYSYKNGFYDWQDREFRGFGQVTETLPNTAKRIYNFYQDDVLKGRPVSVQTTDAVTIPYEKSEQVWGIATSSGVMTVRLDSEKNYTYDGATASAKVTETEYQYDSYGNPTKISELGDLDTVSDDRFTYNEYTASTSAWLVNTLKHTYLNDSDDSTKVSETYLYYDQHSGNDDSPHFGNVTKKVDWLSGGSNPETHYTYDSYGNVTSTTDANGHTTTVAYDDTGTYPASQTNAKNQTVTMNYEFGTGNLLSQTDPNNLTTSYEYDSYGRITKEIKPYDNSSYPTISYQYLWDGYAPEGVLVSKREVSSESAILSAFTFIDGLGRTIQTRQFAEDTSKQIVRDMFYDPTGQIMKETVPYLASASAPLTLPTPVPPSATKFGNGRDGDIAITVNTTETPIDSAVTVATGSANATVTAGVGFAANQIVLFHQTQGTNAGLWEYARVASYSGTLLTLTDGLTNSYSSAGNNRAQVRVVPQYHNVIVGEGATWTAKAWDGTTGGVFTFLANGTVTVNGTITATGKGFRGGTDGTDDAGWTGEGTGGVSVQGNTADPSGNGGGFYHVSSAGGGHAETINGFEGTVGSSAGTDDLTTMVFGGGGAGGGSSNSDGTGGAGGGIIMIRGAVITVTGTIPSAGTIGGNTLNGRPGGGGAGGSILVAGQTLSVGSSLVMAPYGNAGTGGSQPLATRGSVGRIRIAYETSVTGTASPSASVAQTTIPLIPGGVVPEEPSLIDYGIYVTPDPTAKYTEYEYDVLGRVSIMTSPKGDMKTTAYDHWKVTNIDEKGAIKRNYLNAFDKITKVEEVVGATTSATLYTYNAREDLTQIVDDASNVFSFAYDTLSRKTSQTDPDMGTWSYGYDAVGNLTSTTDARSVTTTRTYDQLNRLLTVNYPTDTGTSFAYDLGKIGTLAIATDSAGTVSYTYDNRLRKTEESRTINGTTKTTSFAYDALDRLTSQTNPDSEVVTYTFNNQGEIESATASANLVSNFDYNALGKITKKDFGNGVTTNYTYNTNDFRLNRIQTGSLFDKNYTYDDVGNIATITDNLTAKVQTFTYDDLDRLTTASESAGFDYEYEYNSIGNLTKFTNAGIDLSYTYGSGSAIPHALTALGGGGSGGGGGGGASSSAVPVVRSSSSGTISSGGLTLTKPSGTVDGDLLIMTASADLSSSEEVTYTIPGGWTQILANTRSDASSAGNNLQVWYKIASSEPADYTITPDHDNLIGGSIIRIDGHDATDPIDIQNVTASATGEADAPAVTTTIDKVLVLRLLSWDQSKTVNSIPSGHTQIYHADVSGHDNWGGYEEQATAGDTGEAQFDLSAGAPYVGLTLGIKPIQVSTEYIFHKGVNFNGNAVTIEENSWQSWTTALSSGLSVPSGYYSANTSVTPNPAGETDTSGVMNSAIWKENSPLTINQTLENGDYQVYFWIMENYQNYNRKIDVELENVQVADDIGYLPKGDWVKYGPYDVTVIDGTLNVELINVMDSPHVMGMAIYEEIESESSSTETTFAYDQNGNMTGDGLKLFEYNEANQLKTVKLASNSATLAEYIYDYKGKRIIKKNYLNGILANTVTSWTPSYETKVIEGGGTEETVYYYANGELVARKNNDDSITYYHTDHLGSTSVLTNQAGSLVEATSYDPWGEVLAGGTQSKFQYTGKEKDAETGLNYYESRYYSSDIHRFVQPDTWLPDIYDPQQLNRYSYANNNPLKYTDPTGHVGEILKYNQALTQYYKKPSAITYNNVLNTAASIQKQSGNTTNRSSSNSSGSSNGGNSAPPKNDNSGARDVIKQGLNSNPVSKFLAGNDVNTLTSSKSTFSEKGWASVSFIPIIGKIGKVPKAVEDVVGASKVFNPDQAALIDLAKEAQKTGVSADDANTLVRWAEELGINNHSIKTHQERGGYWSTTDHIKIFKYHIPIND